MTASAAGVPLLARIAGCKGGVRGGVN